MLFRLEKESQIPSFIQACTYERVFGSKAAAALRAWGLADSRFQFYLSVEGGEPAAALYLAEGILTVAASQQVNPEEIADLARREAPVEVNTSLDLAEAVQKRLGGEMESSCFMVYQGRALPEVTVTLSPGRLPDVFSVLQKSHEYYRKHAKYDSWSADWERRLSLGLSEVYQLERDGQVIGTGSVGSEDDECGIVGAVAVVPEWRHRGLGGEISRFLTRRILEKGKTPRLMAGYDAVAELYRQVGFTECGRWGELYLTGDE